MERLKVYKTHCFQFFMQGKVLCPIPLGFWGGPSNLKGIKHKTFSYTFTFYDYFFVIPFIILSYLFCTKNYPFLIIFVQKFKIRKMQKKLTFRKISTVQIFGWAFKSGRYQVQNLFLYFHILCFFFMTFPIFLSYLSCKSK